MEPQGTATTPELLPGATPLPQDARPARPRRRAFRLLGWFLPAFLVGAGLSWGAFTFAERIAARRLGALLAAQGLEARWQGLRVSARGTVLLSGLRLARAGQAVLELRELRLVPAGRADLLAGAQGSWQAAARGWRLLVQPAGGPGLCGQGETASLRLAGGRLGAAEIQGRIVQPVETGFQASGGRGPTGGAFLRVEFTPALALGALLAAGMGRPGAGSVAAAGRPLPAWLEALTVQAVGWEGQTGTVTLEGLGLGPEDGASGIGGAIERVELALADPGGMSLRSLRLVRPRLALDPAAIMAGTTPPAGALRETSETLQPVGQQDAAPRSLEERVHQLAELLRLVDEPELAALEELSVADGELRLGRGEHDVVLEGLALRAVPRAGVTLAASARGPWGSSAKLAGELQWPQWQDGVLRLQGELALEQGRLSSPAVAPQPVEGLDLHGRGWLTFHPARGELELQTERLVLQGLEASLRVRGKRIGQRPPAFAATVSFPKQRCQRLADAVPDGMAPLLAGMRIEGQMSGRLRVGLDLAVPEEPITDLRLEGQGFTDCRIRSLGQVQVEWLSEAFVHLIEPPGEKRLRPIKVGPGTEDYVPLAEIPSYVLKSMLVTENSAFYEVGPVSLRLVRGALNLNLTHRRYIYGGSTISQQLVKNLFLDRRKDLARKLQEAFIAWRMEELISKDRILELYVNCIEFGPGVYGIERASRFYFGHGAQELTPVEGAFLATIKPKPSEGPRLARKRKLHGWWQQRMTKVMRILEQEGEISPDEREAAYPYQPDFHLEPPRRT